MGTAGPAHRAAFSHCLERPQDAETWVLDLGLCSLGQRLRASCLQKVQTEPLKSSGKLQLVVRRGSEARFPDKIP